MKVYLGLSVVLILVGCSSTPVASSDAQAGLEAKYGARVGKAVKADFVQDFGTPQWCKPESLTGTETCRFYKKLETKWIGEKPDRKPFDTYDEVVAEFDASGTLRAFKAKSQR